MHIAHMLLNKIGYDVTAQLRHHLIVSRASRSFNVISRLLQKARDVFEKCDSISGLARTISAIAQLSIRSGEFRCAHDVTSRDVILKAILIE